MPDDARLRELILIKLFGVFNEAAPTWRWYATDGLPCSAR